MRNFLVFGLIFLLASCNEKAYDMTDFYKVYGGDSVETYLNEISDQIIIFGHQSVGNNILSGIGHWEKESGVKLNRESARTISDSENPAFIDFLVGNNGDPLSKIDDFVSVIESIPTEISVITLFKFCYVDINEHSDVDEIYLHLKDKMLYLKQNYSHVQVVLTTVPLSIAQTGMKAKVKKMLNKKVYGVMENIKMHQLNERIRIDLSNEFPLFDLAKVETTLPNGEESTYKIDGNVYPCLPGYYTYDTGHLNETGSKVVSYNLLAFLAEVMK